jgi:hypothetical protein
MSTEETQEALNFQNAESKDNSFEEEGQKNEEIIVEHLKISDVPKDSQIRLNSQTLFQFSTDIENDKLVLKLNEIGAFSPFIYLKKLTLDDFIKNHKMFRSCENLQEVQNHFAILFANNKIKLTQNKDEENAIILNIKTRNISEDVQIKIEGERKMTTRKDESLMKLYKIQKNEIKILKEIENFIKENEKDGVNDIIKKIKDIKSKYLKLFIFFIK